VSPWAANGYPTSGLPSITYQKWQTGAHRRPFRQISSRELDVQPLRRRSWPLQKSPKPARLYDRLSVTRREMGPSRAVNPVPPQVAQRLEHPGVRQRLDRRAAGKDQYVGLAGIRQQTDGLVGQRHLGTVAPRFRPHIRQPSWPAIVAQSVCPDNRSPCPHWKRSWQTAPSSSSTRKRVLVS
jgi:hypothetical protein